ncbi:sensor histidine kinase [Streptomyces sp. MMG1121]|uniref:sensor histidine kinase n=1 Tax=Streptomyces sp. MMG1121 TaxID=1415544 RepID=UPI0006C05522|nr:HAMP domain-containing sensor histidine kinase [Streptomyces sp. MMG1121]KOV69224.1 histidine kinase [Streptomyces sp. MMG1121]
MSGTPGPRGRRLRGHPTRDRRTRTRPLRTRLLLLVTATLAGGCLVLALTAVLAQRAFLMGALDERVDAVAHGVTGAARHRAHPADLAFLGTGGQPDGLLAARSDTGGTVLAAAVVRGDGGPRPLTADQRAALSGVPDDGSPHTRTVPGLGAYRVTVLDTGGIRVLAGLPLDDVRHTLGRLVRAEAAATGVVLLLAGGGCTLAVRWQLRPLERLAATAAEVARVPLAPDRPAPFARVPAADADPGTETGQVGAALNRMADQVEAALAERRRGEERVRRFIADAGHELRTPLASIAGYAELMDRAPGPLAADLARRRIGTESARMTGLVENLLLLARLAEGRSPRTAEVDLAVLVAEAVRDARRSGPDHVWHLELPPEPPMSVKGDAPRLRQAVSALLANARVHTPPGTTVTVAVVTTGGHHAVRVRDDGPGIPHDLLPAVFDPFTRADASRTRTGLSEGGSGLGLAVAAAITRAHGGAARADSVPGRTEFTVEFPAAAVPLQAASSAPGTGRRASRVLGSSA